MEPVVVEDSEPDEPVVRKVSRNKKNVRHAKSISITLHNYPNAILRQRKPALEPAVYLKP